MDYLTLGLIILSGFLAWNTISDLKRENRELKNRLRGTVDLIINSLLADTCIYSIIYKDYTYILEKLCIIFFKFNRKITPQFLS